jgi:hypothetical protein
MMLKQLLLIPLFSFAFFISSAQELCNCNTLKKKGGTFYWAGGYNFDRFSNSTIHFKNTGDDNYNFTLYHLKAIDRDGLNNLFNEDITIPQYSFRIGYYFNDKHNLGIEINYDHVKYVVVQNQRVRLKGEIRGTSYDQDTLLTAGFLQFEHTNGANYAMIDFIKRHTLFSSPNKKHWLSTLLKPGIGFVYPRSDVTIFGKRQNDKYHVAGYVAGVELGFRYDAFKYLFIETAAKGAFANYLNVRLADNGKAHHHFFSLEYIATIGFQFGIN